MITVSKTHRRRKVSKSSGRSAVTRILTPSAEHNKSTAEETVAALTPKIFPPGFDAKRLETFSLGDFVELLEAAGMMPTGAERVVTAEELATAPAIEMDFACVDRLRESRFRFLVDHLRPSDTTTGLLDRFAVAGLLQFLHSAHSLFFDLLNLKRREIRVGRTENVPIAERAQDLFTCFTVAVPAAWLVPPNGRLTRQPFPAERDPTRRLVERLLKVLDGADPARIRRCAFKNCQRVFYAKRADQLCCSRRCNNNRLQREWYAEHGKSAVYQRPNRKEHMP
jgi:hypothetical protein